MKNRNRLTDKENKFVITKLGGRGGVNWKIAFDIYTLLYIT